MTDIVSRLRERGGQKWPSLMGEAAAEIERLRDDRWKHGAESMRHAILQLLPGGQTCDPQQIADAIRAIALPSLDEQTTAGGK